MPNVQVAFQGGGAKLVNLLAAAQALEEAHNRGDITITRVAGTSAGSIAACILVSGIGVANARTSLRTNEMRAVADNLSASRPLLSALWSAYHGNPLMSLEPLRQWLSSFLGNGNPSNKRVRDVCAMRQSAMKLLIVSSDIANRNSHLAADTDFILDAIESSCGIPFAFRTWKNQGYSRVDGGLCANLPVDFLRDDEDVYGDVLAISFDRPLSAPHDNFKDYILALIDTAISSGEDRARDSLPAPHVFSINTDLTTFNFKAAFEKGLADQYDVVHLRAEKWISKFSEIKKQESLVLAHDPWKDQSVASKQFLVEMGKYFTALSLDRPIHYRSARLQIYAPSLALPINSISGSNDRIKLSLRFATDSKPVHMLSLSVANVDEHTALDATSLDCRVRDSAGNPVQATLIPMSLSSDRLERNVAVCFHSPLAADTGDYELTYTIRGSQLLRTLQVHGEDVIGYFPRGPIASTTVGRVELIAIVPRDYPIRFSFMGEGENCRSLRPDELPHTDFELHDVDIFGCVADNVPRSPNDLWRLMLTVRSKGSAANT